MHYGDDVPELTYDSSWTLYGSPEISTTATKTSPVGTYPIKVEKGTLTNEYVTYVDGTLTINKALVMITAKDYTIKQGQALPTFEATYEGFKNNETETVLTQMPTFTTTATSDSEPGEYWIAVSGAEAENYWFDYLPGKLTIEEATDIKGDANGDGTVDATDIVEVVNYILNKPSDKFNEDAADANGDGVVDAADIEAIVNIIMNDGATSEETTYYWYAGQTDPSTMTEISPMGEWGVHTNGIECGVNGGGWYELGTTVPETITQLVKGGDSTKYWYVAVPITSGTTLKPVASDMTTIDTSVSAQGTKSFNGVSYQIYWYGGAIGARNTFHFAKK
jgi:hypothetical protein